MGRALPLWYNSLLTNIVALPLVRLSIQTYNRVLHVCWIHDTQRLIFLHSIDFISCFFYSCGIDFIIYYFNIFYFWKSVIALIDLFLFYTDLRVVASIEPDYFFSFQVYSFYDHSGYSGGWGIGTICPCRPQEAHRIDFLNILDDWRIANQLLYEGCIFIVYMHTYFLAIPKLSKAPLYTRLSIVFIDRSAIDALNKVINVFKWFYLLLSLRCPVTDLADTFNGAN